MSLFAHVVEERIQEAILSGELDAPLKGSGMPLNLDDYFATPSSLRAGFSLLKNAHTVPPEVEAMNQVHKLRQQIAATTKPELQAALRKEMLLRETEVAMAMERMKHAIKADATF